MDGRVAHLHSRYRVFGARGGGARGGAAARLGALKRERLAGAFSDALDAALGGEEAVYVLRRVRARVGLTLGEDTTDARAARHWGEQLAGAVVRALAADAGDGANLVRFETQADFVAQFVTALLGGDAWGRWYFAAFAPLRADSVPATLGRVLLDNRPHLAQVLARLEEGGVLGAVLDALDGRTRRALWDGGAHDEARAVEAESIRPLYALALGLVDSLGAWASARAGEELLQSYLETLPPAPDWHDPRALAASLLDVLLFLDRRGRLGRAADDGLREALDRALVSYDWLDADWLRGALVELLGGEQAPRLPARRGATPRQRELLEALGALAGEGGLASIGGESGDPYADALRLYAALVGREPRWADDAAAKTTIRHLLAVRRLPPHAASTDALMRRLRQGDAEGALLAVAEDRRASVAAAVRFVAALGDAAVTLLEKLGGGKKSVPTLEGVGVESACAGLSLLLRTVLDTRLHTLDAAASGEPAVTDTGRAPAAPLTKFTKLIPALGLRLFGTGAATAGEFLDAGLCVPAGLEGRLTLDGLRAAWAGDDAGGERLQAALLRAAAGQRLLRAGVMHLYRVELEGGEAALVAADESVTLWPLGRLIGEGEDASAVVAAWLDLWKGAAGLRPRVVADADLALKDGTAFGEEVNSAGEELSSLHESGRAGLREALAALGGGRLGLPGVDLSVALAACSLLRLWARWLRGFSASGVPFLVENFVRRRGRLYAGRDSLVVELERAPLDIVLETAGYLAELERVPWLGGRRLRFRLRGV